jgi:hypothetical protein
LIQGLCLVLSSPFSLQEDKSRVLMKGTFGQKITAPVHAMAGTTSRLRASGRSAICEIKNAFGDSAHQGLGLKNRKFYQHGILVPNESLGSYAQSGSTSRTGQPVQAAASTTAPIVAVPAATRQQQQQQQHVQQTSTTSTTSGSGSNMPIVTAAAAGGAGAGALAGAGLAQRHQGQELQQQQQAPLSTSSGASGVSGSSGISGGAGNLPIHTAN